MRAERLKKYTFKNEIRGTKKREREKEREYTDSDGGRKIKKIYIKK